jgi:conjugative relaxase-like TrwC/TraI family protein
MVMTLAKITAGTGYTYLTRHTARGDAGQGNDRDAAAYYTAQGNPPGRWTGRGAPLLSLAGREVTEDQMRALFGVGAPPDMDAMVDAYMDAHWRPWMTGDRLHRLAEDAVRHATLGRQFPEYRQLEPFGQRVQTRLDMIRQETRREPAEAEIRKVKAEEARRQRAAVAGFDLAFSPVKSAALLWALDERPWVRDAIRDAHEEAKNAALDLLEDHAALTRTGTDGVAQIATKGLIAAEFEHWNSRAGDPNLHTHVAISSKVLGVDGTWRALDASPLYRMIVAASETYNTAFEAALTARLGVTFTARPDTRGGREPVREITGVPFAMIEFFSRRRVAIESRYAELVRGYWDEHGHDPSVGTARQLAQKANLDTRQGKKPPRPLADKRAAWRGELTARFGPGAVAQLMKAVPSAPPAQVPEGLPATVDLKDLAERTVAAVSTRRSTWTVWNLHAEVERLLRTEVPALAPEHHRDLAATVTALAVSPACSISVEAPAILNEPAELRRADGEPVFTEHNAGRFTSQRVLDAETRLANAARTPTATGLPGPSIAAALDGFEARSGTTLDAGQRDLVTSFASDSRLLLAGIGPAGSGKTIAMRALAYVLRHGGRT